MAANDNNESDGPDYQVGYGRPPRHTQFKPGQSGNPKGRSKKSTNFTEIVSKLLRKLVTITIEGKVQRIPMIEAIALTHIAKAAKGNHRSTQMVLGAHQASKSDPGDNLAELLRQFRAISARHEGHRPLPPASAGADHSNNNKDDEAQ